MIKNRKKRINRILMNKRIFVPFAFFFVFMFAYYEFPMLWILPISSTIFSLIGAGIIAVLQYEASLKVKKYRVGEEYGSAAWGGIDDIKPYLNPTFKNNVLLTNTERLTIGTPSDIEYARNINTVVIGGSGSGKTRFFIKPNLLQMHSSYCLTDPKGTVLLECGSVMRAAGYKVKIVNLKDLSKSMKYNPFEYIKTELDIIKFVTALIENTNKEKGGGGGDQFWTDATKLLLAALIGFIHFEVPQEEKNMSSLLDMINNMEISENDESFKNSVDMMFEELEEQNPEHFAVRQYKKFIINAGKTAKGIIASVGVRLMPFDIQEVRDLTEYDQLELDKIGNEKTVLFILTDDKDPTLNFLAGVMYTQLFGLLIDKADNEYGGSLPIPVRFLLDEFANLGKIPNFEQLIATIRSRNISANIVLQNLAQLKDMYKDSAGTILGNCDTMLFLGSKEKETLKEISELLGKATIDTYNTSKTYSEKNSDGLNYQKLGRELMTVDELGKMPGGKCILHIRGAKPFFSDKFKLEKHKYYKYTSDAHKKYLFDINKYLKSMSYELETNESDEFAIMYV